MKKYGLYCYLGDKSLKTALPLVRLSYGTKVKALYESLTKTERSYLAKEFKASMKEKPYRSVKQAFRLLYFHDDNLLGCTDVLKGRGDHYISLAVRKEARHMGIGSLFAEAAMSMADYDYTVNPKNKASFSLVKKIYARHGFCDMDVFVYDETTVTFPMNPRELAAETGAPLDYWL